MGQETIGQMREDAEKIFRSGLKAVDPYRAVKRFLRADGDHLIVGGTAQREIGLRLSSYDHILLVGGGKATAPMARAVEEIVGGRIEKGLINVRYGFGEKLVFTEIVEAGHPVPDENGVNGTRRILELLAGAGNET